MAFPIAVVVRRLLTSRSFRLLLIRLGPTVAAQAVNLARHGQWRQLAILHADSLVAGAFSREVLDDGAVHWVVWGDGQPAAAYPPYEGSLADALVGHDPAIRRRPEELPTRRARQAGGHGARWMGAGLERIRRAASSAAGRAEPGPADEDSERSQR